MYISLSSGIAGAVQFVLQIFILGITITHPAVQCRIPSAPPICEMVVSPSRGKLVYDMYLFVQVRSINLSVCTCTCTVHSIITGNNLICLSIQTIHVHSHSPASRRMQDADAFSPFNLSFPHALKNRNLPSSHAE